MKQDTIQNQKDLEKHHDTNQKRVETISLNRKVYDESISFSVNLKMMQMHRLMQ